MSFVMTFPFMYIMYFDHIFHHPFAPPTPADPLLFLRGPPSTSLSLFLVSQ